MQKKEILENFKFNVRLLLAQRGWTPAELSRRCGYENENKVANILRSNSFPGLQVPYEFAQALQVNVAALYAFRPSVRVEHGDDSGHEVEGVSDAVSEVLGAPNFKGPIVDKIMDWWIETNGDLSQLGKYRRFVELFQTPDASEMLPQPYEIGAGSLGASQFGIDNCDHLSKLFQASNRTIAQSVAHSHFTALNGQPSLNYLQMEIHEGGEVIYSVKYMRVLLRVRTSLPRRGAEQKTFILNYSKPTSIVRKNRNQPFKLLPGRSQQPVFSILGGRGDCPAIGSHVDLGE